MSWRAQAGDDFCEISLAVARDTGNPDDFSRPHLEVDVCENLRTVSFEVHLRDREQHLPCRRFCTSRHDVDLAPHHQLGQPLHIGLTSRYRARDSATTHHRDAIGDVDNLPKFVADEDHGLPCMSHRANGNEELLHFWWRQECRRFVE